VTPRHIRRWRQGVRSVPRAAGLLVNLLVTGVISIDQAEAAVPVPTRTNGHAKPVRLESSRIGSTGPAEPVRPTGLTEPDAPGLTEPAGPPAPVTPPPEPLTEPSSSVAEQVMALGPEKCRWPHGDPRCPDEFWFCNNPAKGPYCADHMREAYLPAAPRRGVTK